MKVVIVGGVAGGASWAHVGEKNHLEVARGEDRVVKRVADSQIRSQRGKEKGS